MTNERTPLYEHAGSRGGFYWTYGRQGMCLAIVQWNTQATFTARLIIDRETRMFGNVADARAWLAERLTAQGYTAP